MAIDESSGGDAIVAWKDQVASIDALKKESNKFFLGTEFESRVTFSNLLSRTLKMLCGVPLHDLGS
jgi:hypothetical protein